METPPHRSPRLPWPLGNQLKYLELDLSDNAIAKLKSSNQDLSGTAKELQSRVAGLEGEIRRYIAALT